MHGGAGQSGAAAAGPSRKRAAGSTQQPASKRVTAERLDVASPAQPGGQLASQATPAGAQPGIRLAQRLLSAPDPPALLSIQLHSGSTHSLITRELQGSNHSLILSLHISSGHECSHAQRTHSVSQQVGLIDHDKTACGFCACLALVLLLHCPFLNA